MYYMRNIISHDYEIPLPKCMYHMKNPYDSKSIENEIDICAQVTKLVKIPNDAMTELEQRQDQLIKKLDVLHERIKNISSLCAQQNQVTHTKKSKVQAVSAPEEIVLNVNPDCLPWYLFVFLKDTSTEVNISWHIHSSVSNEKINAIHAFLKNFKSNSNSKVNLRLIFKKVFSNSELKLSSLAVPILGNVNILRYLSLAYPNTVPYDVDDYHADGLLDICYLLENSAEKDKDALVQKLFVQCKDWIHNNEFSIVDVAAFNVIKQMRNKPKSVPSSWFTKCQKMFEL